MSEELAKVQLDAPARCYVCRGRLLKGQWAMKGERGYRHKLGKCGGLPTGTGKRVRFRTGRT